MPPSPLTPRTRQHRIAAGRARFDALKKARIARMREAALEEADMHALVRSAPTTPRSTSPLSPADNDDWDVAPPASAGGALAQSAGGLTRSNEHTAHIEAALERERAMRLEAEAARSLAEEERARCEGLLAVAREQHAGLTYALRLAPAHCKEKLAVS